MSTKEASRRSPQDDAWSLRIKQRAGWKCEWCGLSAAEIKALGGELQAAHIAPRWDWPEMALDDTNGKALCTFKDPRHRHPTGKGLGYGCHNSMSGHWKTLNMPTVPTRTKWLFHKDHKLTGAAMLAAAGVLWVLHYALVGWVALALSAELWPELGLSILVWAAALVADGYLRHYVSLRPYLIGPPQASFTGFLTWLTVLLALWGACLILCHLALRRRWLSRAGHTLLHALVRLAKRVRGT